MKITYYGHSCVSVETGRNNILIDPFITPNGKASHIDITELKPDCIFLTHGHEDHVADAVAVAKASGAQVIAGFEVINWISKQGIENVHPVNQGGLISLPFGMVKVVNAVHSSSLPDGSYGGNPLGYVFLTDEGNFYHSGDTALTYDMKIIGKTTPAGTAALCIGDNFTMGIEDAATAAEWVGAKKVVGIHYDTFPPIEINHQAARDTFSRKGIELLLPGIGESVSL